jgi:hypothetical protein
LLQSSTNFGGSLSAEAEEKECGTHPFDLTTSELAWLKEQFPDQSSNLKRNA